MRVITMIVIVSILLVISIIDFKIKIIPNQLNVLLFISEIGSGFVFQEVTFLSRFLGVFSVSIPMFILAILCSGGLGGGDVKLMAASGVLLGIKWNIFAAWAAGHIQHPVAGEHGLDLAQVAHYHPHIPPQRFNGTVVGAGVAFVFAARAANVTRKNDVVVVVKISTLPGRVAPQRNGFHLIAAAQVEPVAGGNGDQLIVPVGDNIPAVKFGVDVPAVFVKKIVPDVGVHGTAHGERFVLMAVAAVELRIAVGVVKSYVDADGNVLETDNSDAEKFDMTSLLRRSDDFDEEVSVYGVETDSAYVKLKDMDSLKDNEVYISDSFADKYGIKPGDTIKLDAQYEKKTYKFKVKGTYDKSQSIAVFMPIS